MIVQLAWRVQGWVTWRDFHYSGIKLKYDKNCKILSIVLEKRFFQFFRCWILQKKLYLQTIKLQLVKKWIESAIREKKIFLQSEIGKMKNRLGMDFQERTEFLEWPSFKFAFKVSEARDQNGTFGSHHKTDKKRSLSLEKSLKYGLIFQFEKPWKLSCWKSKVPKMIEGRFSRNSSFKSWSLFSSFWSVQWNHKVGRLVSNELTWWTELEPSTSLNVAGPGRAGL